MPPTAHSSEARPPSVNSEAAALRVVGGDGAGDQVRLDVPTAPGRGLTSAVRLLGRYHARRDRAGLLTRATLAVGAAGSCQILARSGAGRRQPTGVDEDDRTHIGPVQVRFPGSPGRAGTSRGTALRRTRVPVDRLAVDGPRSDRGPGCTTTAPDRPTRSPASFPLPGVSRAAVSGCGSSTSSATSTSPSTPPPTASRPGACRVSPQPGGGRRNRHAARLSNTSAA